MAADELYFFTFLTDLRSVPGGSNWCKEDNASTNTHVEQPSNDLPPTKLPTDCITSDSLLTNPPVCTNTEQFRAWQRTRKWLVMSNTGSMMSEVCSQVKKPGIFNEQGQHNEQAFVNVMVSACKSAKVLLKKIDT